MTVKLHEMSKYEIPYITFVIRTFASRFHMTRQTAYEYLLKYQGLAFLIKYYDVEHLQDVEETVDELIIKCQQHGGTLAC